MSRVRSSVLDFYTFDDITLAKNTLLDAVNHIQLEKPLSRYPDRHGSDRSVRQLDDIFDIIKCLDERMVLDRLPLFVAVNSDTLPSPRMDEGELRTLMNRINKVEAILYNLQTAVHSIHASLDCVVNKVSTFTTTIDQFSLHTSGKPITENTPQPDALGNPIRNAHIGNPEHQAFLKPRWSDIVSAEEQLVAGSATDSGDDYTVYESRRHRMKRRKQASGSPIPITHNTQPQQRLPNIHQRLLNRSVLSLVPNYFVSHWS